MGSKYTTQTVTGYNASPPSDNGAVSANNIVSWGGTDGVKTNLGDPLNAFAGAVNTALLAALDFGTRAAAGNETCTAADHMKSIECPVAMTGTLMDAATAGAGFIVGYKNTGAGAVTIALQTAGNTLNGTAGSSVPIANSDGIVWFQVNAAATGYNSSIIASKVALNAALPLQGGNAGKYVTTDGTNASWSALKVPGLSTGTTTFASANAGASNYTLTLPAVTDTVAVLGANTFTARQTIPAVQTVVVDKGTVSTGTVTFDASAGMTQRLQVGGALTVAFSNLPAAGSDEVMKIEMVNWGSAVVTLPTINWQLPAGGFTTTFATYMEAIGRAALQSAGKDFGVFWLDVAGTLYGKLI